MAIVRARQWLAVSQFANAPQNARSESNLGLVKTCLLRVEELSERGHERALLLARELCDSDARKLDRHGNVNGHA